MSVFSVTALDRLIEADRRSSSSSETTPRMEKQNYKDRRPLYVSYPYSSTTSASPSPRPRSPSPSSYSPSPFVVNHKRRVPNGVDSKRTSQQNGFHVSDKSSVSRPCGSQEFLVRPSARENSGSPLNARQSGTKQDEPLAKEHSRSPQSNLTLQFQAKKVSNGDSKDDESRQKSLDEDYSNGSMSAAEEKTKGKRVGGERREMTSKNDDPRGKKKLEDRSGEGTSGQAGSASSSSEKVPNVPRGDGRTSSGSSSEEWFDAAEGPFPDYSSDDDARRLSVNDPGPSSRGDSDSNIVLKLRAEIQRRIAAEEAREALQQQRDGMAQMLSSAGISLPQSDLGDVKITEYDKVVGFSDSEKQRLMVARYVAGAVATGAVRAEAEAELQTVLAEKSKEIARLKDKLQYYEVVNHEMSQRNQESIENARQTRRRRQRRQRLVVFGLSAAVCVGVSIAAVYHYVPWEHVKSLSTKSMPPEGELPSPESLEKVVDFGEAIPEN